MGETFGMLLNFLMQTRCTPLPISYKCSSLKNGLGCLYAVKGTIKFLKKNGLE